MSRVEEMGVYIITFLLEGVCAEPHLFGAVCQASWQNWERKIMEPKISNL